MLTILQGDALEKLRELPDESVQCCVTSPPFWGLRDYGTAKWEGGEDECDHRGRSQTSGASTLNEWKNGGGQRYKEETGGMPFANECGKCGARRIDSQLGLEKTPEEYVAKLVEVFREVRRILRNDGTLWLNLGDSYAAGKQGRDDEGPADLARRAAAYGTGVPKAAAKGANGVARKAPDGMKPKDLVGIPWMVAFALRADGWWLRSDIIWAKPNPMPESVTDRPTKSHEYIFLLTKSARYFYDAHSIYERATIGETGPETSSVGLKHLQGPRFSGNNGHNLGECNGSRNKRSVWRVATNPYPDAHFATYPPDLIKPCILAGTSARGCCADCGAPWERMIEHPDFANQPKRQTSKDAHLRNGDRTSAGQAWQEWRNQNPSTTLGWQPTCKCEAAIVPCTVLDPFAGSGTTGMVALEIGRRAILIELNPKYVALIEARTNITLGLALA
jgi:DNA modification methylase